MKKFNPLFLVIPLLFSCPMLRGEMEHFTHCREMIQPFGSNHRQVLEKYDAFAKAIWEAYVAGEGLTERDIDRIVEGIEFATLKHAHESRKDASKTPYIIHPIGVAFHLLTIGNVRDPDILIAALLHDTVEDTDTTFLEIEQKFGSRVAGFVREVTDDKSLPKAMRKQLQVEHASEKSAGAAQIKLGDKLYNLIDLLESPPPDWPQERIDDYFHWAKKVVDLLPWVNGPLKQAVDKVINDYFSQHSS